MSSPHGCSSCGVERAQTVENNGECLVLTLTIYPPTYYCFLKARSLWSTQSQANRTNEKQSGTIRSINGILTDADDGEDGEKPSTEHSDKTARKAVREKIMVFMV